MEKEGGTIKNVVFREIKSGQVTINSAEVFCKAANQFCPSITTLFQNSDVILHEPSDIEETSIILGTLKIHKFTHALPLQPEKPKSMFSSYRIARNLVVPKNTPTIKDAGT